MATQLRAVPRETVEPAPRQITWAPVDGDLASQLLERIERKRLIVELATNGLAHELRKLDPMHPLRRYAAIAALTAEELAEDLYDLHHTLYGR